MYIEILRDKNIKVLHTWYDHQSSWVWQCLCRKTSALSQWPPNCQGWPCDWWPSPETCRRRWSASCLAWSSGDQEVDQGRLSFAARPDGGYFVLRWRDQALLRFRSWTGCSSLAFSPLTLPRIRKLTRYCNTLLWLSCDFEIKSYMNFT